MEPEARARVTIDELLRAAGWTLQDRDELNLQAASGVALRELSFFSGEPDQTLLADGNAAGYW